MPASPPSSSEPDNAPATSTRGERKHVFSYIGNRFFTGFAVAIPLIVTIWMLNLSYRFILYVGRPVIEIIFHGINLSLERTTAQGNLITPPEWFLNVFGILTPVILFIILGVMATNVLGARIISLVDQILSKFPIISFIYSGLKQVMDSFRNFGAGRNFKRVAYVEYPSPGCRLIGFVTGQYHDTQIGKDVTSIFIPTSPNPMTGFVIVAENDRVFDSSLTIDQASKVILSAGLVAPEFGPQASPSTGEIATEEKSSTSNAHASLPAIPVSEPGTSVEGEGKDPVVRHDEPAGKPASNAFDGLTGYESENL